MPAARVAKSQVLERLLALFRERGYDGASLAELSAVTGLGKSSLYHHFPGGKEDMARQALGHLERGLEQALFAPLRAAGDPPEKLGAMLDAIRAFYEGGRRACLLERLAASVASRRFREPLSKALTTWIESVAELCVEAGLPRPLARARAEDLVVRIEGALVVSAALGDTAVFERTIDELRRTLLAPA
jgi:TetR/AcrR family transcriptional regulator, lmrAB and yxaGH operons repressor